VRDLVPQETQAAVGVLARGMRDNPLHVAAYGQDPDRRLRCHARLMRAFLGIFGAQELISAHRDGTLVAVAGVAPARTCQPTAGQRLRMVPTLVALGPGTAARVGKWLSTWARQDLDEPHLHLGPVAVDAHLQGQGIGTIIMREHCRRADTAGAVSYLDRQGRKRHLLRAVRLLGDWRGTRPRRPQLVHASGAAARR
jgi:GNAT superfamily N-acetyltransferase